MRQKNISRANRALDQRVAEMYDNLGYITRDGDEFYGWDHAPFDPRYPSYTHTCFGVIPRYSADAEAFKVIEQKIAAANCLDEYVRDLETMGVNLETATPSERCRAATRIHPVYAEKVKENAPESVPENVPERDQTFKENEARAAEFMAGIEARLVKLVEKRAFRFVDTERVMAEAYLRPMLTFTGLPEEYVTRLDDMRGGLPHVYRAYVRRFGIERGLLYSDTGTRADPFAVPWYQASAAELLQGSGHESLLDADPNIFLYDRDDLFLYFADGDANAFDAPVYRYSKGEAPKQVAAGFAELLEAELRRMEKSNREEREVGGYFITLMGGGMRHRRYPAFNEGHNPVDVEDQFI